MSVTKGQKTDLQTMQNDVLRFAKNVSINDRISRVDLHKDAKLFSLGQRWEKQLFILMYKLSKRGVARQITNRNTRIQQKYVFKTDVKTGKKV